MKLVCLWHVTSDEAGLWFMTGKCRVTLQSKQSERWYLDIIHTRSLSSDGGRQQRQHHKQQQQQQELWNFFSFIFLLLYFISYKF